jgi:hypothetical protein
MGYLLHEITGIADPTSKDDLETIIYCLLDKGKFLIPITERKSQSKKRSILKEICQLGNWNIGNIGYVLERMLEENAGIKFLRSYLGKIESVEVDETVNENKNQDIKIIEKTKGKKEKKPRREFIFLYRSIRRHPYFKGREPILRLIFIDLLLDAAFAGHSVVWRNKKINLMRGQWSISIREAAQEYKVTEPTMRRWLKDMKINNMIDTSPIYLKDDSNGASHDACGGASRDASKYKIGILVTICNYDKWQAIINMKDDSNGASHDACGGASRDAQTEESGISKEGITEEPSPLPPVRKITPQGIYEIWEKERGPLFPVLIQNPNDVLELANQLNSLIGDPINRFIELVKKMRDCDKSYYQYMAPSWFSQDLDRINKLLRGAYDHPYGGSNGKSKSVRQYGTGGKEEFGKKSKEGGSTAKLAAIARAQMSKM